MNEDSKQCSYCAETIKAEAIICRYCGRDLIEAPSQPTSVKRPARNPIFETWGGILLLCVCGFLLVGRVATWEQGGDAPPARADLSAPIATHEIQATIAAFAESQSSLPPRRPSPSPPRPTAPPAPTATATAASVGQSRETAAPLGEAITTEDGWEIKVVSIERNATQRLKAENMFNPDPLPGNEWVVIRLNVTYRGDEETASFSASSVRLTGSQGAIASSGSVVLSDALGGEVFRDGTREGDVAFETAQDEQNLIVIVDTGPSSAWYLATGEVALPIVAEAQTAAGAADAGRSRETAATGPVLADNGMQLQVIGFEPDAGDRLKQENQFNSDAAAGNKYILVQVEGQYLGEGETKRDSDSMWRVVGDKGALYTPAMVVIQDGYSGEVFRFGKLSGWLAYEVPAEEAGWVMVYSGLGTEARFITVPTGQ